MKGNLDRRIDRLEEIEEATHDRPKITRVIVYGEPIPPDADMVIQVSDEQTRELIGRIGERTKGRKA